MNTKEQMEIQVGSVDNLSSLEQFLQSAGSCQATKQNNMLRNLFHLLQDALHVIPRGFGHVPVAGSILYYTAM